MFEGLTKLNLIHSPNYRLCCADFLPAAAIKPNCFTSETTISSCENLLRSSAHLITLLTLCVGVIVATVTCPLLRNIKYKESSENVSFAFLMNFLNLSDFLACVYCSIVLIMDRRFSSEFIRHELEWRRSTLCKTAGVLSVWSQYVSLMLVLVISLERLLKARAPTACLWLFTMRSAIAVGVLTWSAGLALASVPLMPVTEHWEFYGHTAMCVPLPCLFSHGEAGSYQFALEAVLQGFLASMIIACQLIIIVSAPQSSNLKTQNTRDDMTDAFFKVAVTSSLRAVVISTASLVTFLGDIRVAENVAGDLFVFVVHMSAALNPCLYVVGRVIADRRRETQRKLLALLKRQALQKPNEQC